MDKLDLGIIDMLSKNSRTSFMNVARTLKVSESTIRKRIAGLEKRGVIKKYSLVIDTNKIGFESVALIGVDVSPEKYLDVAKKLTELDGIKYVASSTGDHMFMLEVWTKNGDELRALSDKIKGLELGSDDYLAKPFHLSELNARVKAIIRRKSFEGSNEMTFNEIKIDLTSRSVFVNEKEITLTQKEYDLLMYFIANKNKVVTKNSIAEHLWGDDSDQSDSFDFIYTHIKNLRKKLLDKGCEDYITTIYGIGYNFKTQ